MPCHFTTWRFSETFGSAANRVEEYSTVTGGIFHVFSIVNSDEPIARE
jgi:hypothetical protein